jgi:two-component system, NarL family, nitrate/nitrite response regulator NarL
MFAGRIGIEIMSDRKLTRVAIVDDHPLTRKGIRVTLEENGNFDVVAEGASAADAVAIADSHVPDFMLLDINMPGGGVEAAQAIGQKHATIKLMMLTVYDNLANVKASLQAGASGYVLKGVSGDEMISIIDKILNGAKHVSPELAAKILGESEPSKLGAVANDFHKVSGTLTIREEQIHKLIGKGASNRDIADRLQLSEATVKQYASQLFRKLGVKNRVEAALMMKSQG